MASRRQEILEALARELEANPGARITTARLADAVAISEAALYRHFPSKARMFEGLIEFAENGVFGRINQIMEENRQTSDRCARVLYLLLGFAERNPGLVRILLGEALTGEHPRLHERSGAYFERLQTQFRQILREAALRKDVVLRASPEAGARLLTVQVEGRMHQYLRSRFQERPLADWEADWRQLQAALFLGD